MTRPHAESESVDLADAQRFSADSDELNPAPVLSLDGSGRILRANAAARSVFDLTGEVKPSLSSLFPDVSAVRLSECIENGQELRFCGRLGELSLQIHIIGCPALAIARLYAFDVTGFQDIATQADRLRVEHERQLKELMCIYGLAEAITTRETVEDICRDVVQLIPSAWRYPDSARARIVLDEKEYVSRAFEMTRWGQSAAVVAEGIARGMVQVFYVEDCRRRGEEGPFLPAERKLLDALARTLGEAIARRDSEAENRRKAVTIAQERNRLKTILQSIREGVVVTDSEDLIMMVNPTALEVLGCSESDTLGVELLSLINDESFKEEWSRTAAAGEEFTKVVLTIPHEDGARTLWATRSPVPDVGDGETWNITILQDMTREREIDQMKTDFVSAVSHELRTPMTSIKGFVMTLLDKPDMPAELSGHFLSIIDEEADRLIMLIEELLLIARIESGQVLLERSPVDVVKVTRRVLASLDHLAQAKGIRLANKVSSDIDSLLGDEKKIHTMLFNLVENAIKFTSAKGRVRVTLSQDEECVLIDVKDNGVGIPVADQERIFERFYRVHRDGEMESGTGLGLFIVREMVKLHGGEIAVESAPGKGSIFRVRLPLGSAGIRGKRLPREGEYD